MGQHAVQAPLPPSEIAVHRLYTRSHLQGGEHVGLLVLYLGPDLRRHALMRGEPRAETPLSVHCSTPTTRHSRHSCAAMSHPPARPRAGWGGRAHRGRWRRGGRALRYRRHTPPPHTFGARLARGAAIRKGRLQADCASTRCRASGLVTQRAQRRALLCCARVTHVPV